MMELVEMTDRTVAGAEVETRPVQRRSAEVTAGATAVTAVATELTEVTELTELTDVTDMTQKILEEVVNMDVATELVELTDLTKLTNRMELTAVTDLTVAR